jgi:hypothetical protein
MYEYTNRNRLFIAYRIVDSHRGGYEELCLLGHNAAIQ